MTTKPALTPKQRAFLRWVEARAHVLRRYDPRTPASLIGRGLIDEVNRKRRFGFGGETTYQLTEAGKAALKEIGE
jgi:hypothetical protein